MLWLLAGHHLHISCNITLHHFLVKKAKGDDECFALLFSVCSGVVQGCSLSGLLFAVGINPFLQAWFIKSIVGVVV